MKARLCMLAAALSLAGCMAEAPTAAPAVVPQAPVPVATSAGPPLAFAVADAIPEAQLPAAIASFDAALKAKLAVLPLSSAYRMVSGGGQPARLILDADRAFEVGNAQLKPELLLPLADTVDASKVAGAWVIHVIGVASTADEAEQVDLAERRAASVLAYLGGKGIAGGRLRSETRRGSAHSLELQCVPIVKGREARAWMAPESVTARR